MLIGGDSDTTYDTTPGRVAPTLAKGCSRVTGSIAIEKGFMTSADDDAGAISAPLSGMVG